MGIVSYVEIEYSLKLHSRIICELKKTMYHPGHEMRPVRKAAEASGGRLGVAYPGFSLN